MFIGSEAMLFGSFFTAYFFVRVVNPDAPSIWPPPPYEFPKFVAGVNTAILRHLELHDALGAAVDQAQQPPRAAGRPRADDPDGDGVPPDPVHRVRPRRLQHERRRLRIGLLRPHGPPRRARLRRAHAAHDRGRDGPSEAITRPSTTTASSCRGSTGTSSTSCGSSCTSPSTSSDAGEAERMRNPLESEETAFRFVLGTIVVLRADRRRRLDRDLARRRRLRRDDDRGDPRHPGRPQARGAVGAAASGRGRGHARAAARRPREPED